ncbi:YbgS-like family protein [Erwiniaceae bacterium BAC15a-03b]|uniref:YbgS-like family protein n=1 Tax=Winslowiella arboricola TaxID=2978220 RepID=A0A9J6PK40_9GAMM|nr:YbgS-like family protein [Winslowiella arboricola]MCU5774224.1 YbgS-like family protein [Winslowiella arboricola]MCU5776843.1 YbgS-like family protein [Winslowiella arboricola]
MKKFAIVLFTAAMTLGSGAAMAASGNNGTANQAADAGAKAGDANQNLAPNKVDNSKINTGGTTSTTTDNGKLSADEVHKNSQCKDGKCPDVNKKVETGSGTDVNTKTDGTTQ